METRQSHLFTQILYSLPEFNQSLLDFFNCTDDVV